MELLYHIAVAAPVPAILVVLAFTKARDAVTRIILVGSALLLLVVLFCASFIFFCECK
jgi:hypothetical protein